MVGAWRRRFVAFLSCFAMAAGGLVSSAWATAGATIGSAPTVSFGQQEFGSDFDSGQSSCGFCTTWWLLNVTAGDQLKIDFHASGANAEYVSVYRVGTNDYNVNGADPVAQSLGSASGFGEVLLTAPRTGTMPMSFWFDPDENPSATAGPYDFTAYVQHAVVLGLPDPLSLSFSGSLPVAVHNPDGGAISDPGLSVQLQIQPNGQPWETIGSAAASAGSAVVPYTVPASLAGQKVKVRAVASGAAYLSDTSATGTVVLPTPPKPTSAHLRLGHVKASRRHGVTIQGTTAPGVVGRVYVYASCWRAKNFVIVPDVNGSFGGHVRLPGLCLKRHAKHVWVGAVWGGSPSFVAQKVGRLFRIKR
jgi:hypothetical protein